MKSIFAVLALALAMGPAMAVPEEAEPTRRYMLTHGKNQGQGALDTVRENNGRWARRLKYRDIIAVDLTEKELDKLRRHPHFKNAKIELDPPRFLQATNSEETVPYGIPQIQADDLLPGTTPVKVCVVDTGYDIDHGDLPGYERVTGDSLVGGAWDDPGHEHGTHVAGTIAAIGGNGRGVVGVHTGTSLSLHIVKIFTDSGRWTSSSDIIDALDLCVAAGARIVSMSIAGLAPSDQEGLAFSEALANNGVLSIAAAGNGGGTSYKYPAAYDDVVSVGAVDSSQERADFSQRNDQVELTGPGVGVDSTVLDGEYELKDGTSMSTPHVAGAAALLWSRNSGCNATGIRRALALSARDLGASGRDDWYGYGLIQVNDAHNLIAAQGCDLPPPDDVVGERPVADLSADIVEGLSPLTVEFDSSGSSDDEGIVTRVWDFGVGDSVEGNTVESFTYEEDGTYTASVTVIDAEGFSDTASVSIQVGELNLPPEADFSFTPEDDITTGTVLRFDGSLSEDPNNDELSYEWDFDDGDTSSKKKPFHRFSEPGFYRVRLIVSDDSGDDDSERHTVRVVEAPPFSPGDITLTVKLKAEGSKAKLRWSGAATSHVKVMRNGVKIARTKNDGAWTDTSYSAGDSYEICNVLSKDCSDPVTPIP